MAFVVVRRRRTAGGYAKAGVTEAHARPQIGAIVGSRWPSALSANAPSAASAASTVGARETVRSAAAIRLRSCGAFVADLHPERVEDHDRVHAVERALLPGRPLVHALVGHGTDHGRRDLDLGERLEGLADLAHGHAPGVERHKTVR